MNYYLHKLLINEFLISNIYYFIQFSLNTYFNDEVN